jgi:hypothetical protein
VDEPTFDIFRGEGDEDAIWLEACVASVEKWRFEPGIEEGRYWPTLTPSTLRSQWEAAMATIAAMLMRKRLRDLRESKHPVPESLPHDWRTELLSALPQVSDLCHQAPDSHVARECITAPHMRRQQEISALAQV